MAITCKLITPLSDADSNYEQFEFLIEWFGRDGSYNQWLFTDWENANNIDSEVYNHNDDDLIKSVIKNRKRGIDFVAEDLTLNEYITLQSIKEATRINRVYKDGTRERVSSIGGSDSYRQKDGRYNFSFSIALYSNKLPN